MGEGTGARKFYSCLKNTSMEKHLKKPIKASYEVIEKDIHAMGGISRRTQVRINFPDYPGSPVIRVMLNIPANAKKPVPTLLHLSFSPNFLLYDEPGVDEGMAWDIRNKNSGS